MATPQENTAKRMAADILIALIHNGRLVPVHDDNQEVLAQRQNQIFEEAYQGLFDLVKAVKIKETSIKRAAADVLIAAIHGGRYYPNPVAPEDQVKAQLQILAQAYQNLVDVLMKGAKDE